MQDVVKLGQARQRMQLIERIGDIERGGGVPLIKRRQAPIRERAHRHVPAQ
jgi:hypothetical protein